MAKSDDMVYYCLIIIFLCGFCLGRVIGYAIAPEKDGEMQNITNICLRNIKIDYHNLTEDERETVSEMVDNLKGKYLGNVKTITFTKDRDEMYQEEYVGQYRNGDIIVYITGDDEEDENTLCHEVLHSVIRNGMFYSEDIVVELAELKVCYGKT